MCEEYSQFHVISTIRPFPISGDPVEDATALQAAPEAGLLRVAPRPEWNLLAHLVQAWHNMGKPEMWLPAPLAYVA